MIEKFYVDTRREVYQVTINETEYKWVEYGGKLRHQNAKKKGHLRSDGTNGSEADDITGMLGEFVASLALNVAWRGPGTHKGDDLIGGYGVRATRLQFGRLIIKKKDLDDTPYILAVGTKDPLVWRLPGWLYGKDGKRDMFWDKERRIYLVDQPFLRNLSDLIIPLRVSKDSSFFGAAGH